MHSSTRPLEPPEGILRDQIGPSFAELRPGKPATTSTFPAYPDLADLLAKRSQAHPDQSAAQVLATCAGYAYSDAGTLAMMMTRLGLENSSCRQISRSVDAMLINSTAHVVQSRDGRAVIVAFRGTPPLDLISWFLDADVYPERVAAASQRSRGGRDHAVHAGFYRNVRMIRHEVVHALLRALRGESVLGSPTDPSLRHVAAGAPGDVVAREERRQPLEALYVTGHSLGGAMAALFASMLVSSEHSDYQLLADRLEAVYTFGQPMVGSPAFAEQAAQDLDRVGVPFLRFVYRKDPVPLLPPRTLGRFAHFGQEYRYEREWSATESSSAMPWVTGLVTSVVSAGLTRFPLLRNAPFRYKIEDHLPHHYVSALIPEGRIDEFGDYCADVTEQA